VMTAPMSSTANWKEREAAEGRYTDDVKMSGGRSSPRPGVVGGYGRESPLPGGLKMGAGRESPMPGGRRMSGGSAPPPYGNGPLGENLSGQNVFTDSKF
jgi:hypothetical protein